VALTGFDGFSMVRLPPTGVWRLTDWDEPFEPPLPPPPVTESEPENEEARRWDDPDGEFRTLYCATEAEGAFGEKLGYFFPNSSVVLEIESFLVESPDEEFSDDDLAGGLSRVQIEELDWKLGWAPVDDDPLAIDVTSTRTQLSALPGIGVLLRGFGISRFDREALRSPRRGFTRRVVGYLHSEAIGEDGELRACGLHYESRLEPRWECWALWDPLPVDVFAAEIERVSIDHPALRSAAAKLGVALHR
jgi:RES domain